jgi:hypothetical protein
MAGRMQADKKEERVRKGGGGPDSPQEERRFFPVLIITLVSSDLNSNCSTRTKKTVND